MQAQAAEFRGCAGKFRWLECEPKPASQYRQADESDPKQRQSCPAVGDRGKTSDGIVGYTQNACGVHRVELRTEHVVSTAEGDEYISAAGLSPGKGECKISLRGIQHQLARLQCPQICYPSSVQTIARLKREC